MPVIAYTVAHKEVGMLKWGQILIGCCGRNQWAKASHIVPDGISYPGIQKDGEVFSLLEAVTFRGKIEQRRSAVNILKAHLDYLGAPTSCTTKNEQKCQIAIKECPALGFGISSPGNIAIGNDGFPSLSCSLEQTHKLIFRQTKNLPWNPTNVMGATCLRRRIHHPSSAVTYIAPSLVPEPIEGGVISLLNIGCKRVDERQHQIGCSTLALSA
jgi:hypothetical protein